MIPKLERFGLGLILGPLAPLAGLLVFWWAAYAGLPESWIPYAALAGLLLGILADVFFLKRWVGMAHRLGSKSWAVIFLFYSMGFFGFFMGVPVFNAALALPAGFVVGGKLASESADRLRVRKAAWQTAWFTTGVLALVCAASAFAALASASTASDLKGMLGLGFEVTQGMILGLILVGGALLLAVNAGLTFLSVRWTFRLLRPA